MTVESYCQFFHWTHELSLHIDHQTVLRTDQEHIAHYWFVVKRRDACCSDTVRSQRIVQVHHQLVGWLRQLPDVPPFDRTVRRRREEVGVGLGSNPERLVHWISLCGRLHRRKEREWREITIWQRNSAGCSPERRAACRLRSTSSSSSKIARPHFTECFAKHENHDDPWFPSGCEPLCSFRRRVPRSLHAV